jgi:hypothetical protein
MLNDFSLMFILCERKIIKFENLKIQHNYCFLCICMHALHPIALKVAFFVSKNGICRSSRPQNSRHRLSQSAIDSNYDSSDEHDSF